MIDFIEGEIVGKEAQRLILKSGGLGFGILASNQTLASLPAAGSAATVYTNLQLREDDISLYGFATREERSFFELLIQVSGVGPKLALAVLSAYPAPVLKKALVLGDVAALTGISGIGKKTAQRLILELKDKLSKELTPAEIGAEVAAAFAAGGEEAGQAMAALEALGYSRAEVMKVFAGRDLAGLDVEAMIKLGLKHLARF